jgi:UDP-N-acetylmuramyl pentapeptide phosphotransferase/UDP-N-acetylglucosamine-1-phosphate transferase
VRDSNQLPLYFCLAGGLVGCVTSFIAYWLLAALLWFPYWRQLRDYGMHADDIEEAMGAVVVPPIIGVAFLISTLVSLIVVRWTGHPKLVFILLNLVPGLLVTSLGVNAIVHGRGWSEPGFEIACLLIGLGWGAALYMLMVRRRGYTEG